MIYHEINLPEDLQMTIAKAINMYDGMAEELETIKNELDLSDDTIVVIVDEDGMAEEFIALVRHFDLADSENSESATEDENDLFDRGWYKIKTSRESNAINFHKEGCIYSFADDRTDWFPAAFILIKDQLK